MNNMREIMERPGLTGEVEAALHVALLRESTPRSLRSR